MKKIILALGFFFLSSLSYAELHGRNLDSFGLGYDAYYDDVLNITWLANPTLSLRTSFGVLYNPHHITWNQANAWVAAANAYNSGKGYLGINTWRLPGLSPVNGKFYVLEPVKNNGTGDAGYGFKSEASELAHLYYVTLGNLGYCASNDDAPNSCERRASGEYGLLNRGPFPDVSSFDRACFWTGVQFNQEQAFMFCTQYGSQSLMAKIPRFPASFQPWLVTDGDVIGPVDSDLDGVIDEFDNCVDVYNPDQIDDDVDALGNLCDEYPENSNHEFARCDAELEISISELVILENEVEELNESLMACNTDLSAAIEDGKLKDQHIEALQNDNDKLRSLIDSDADGVPDEIDECSGTPPWKWNVKSNGCHQSQISGGK